MNNAVVPFVSIKPTYTTIFTRTEEQVQYGQSRRMQVPNPLLTPEKPKAATSSNSTGYTLSPKAAKRLRMAINWLTLYSQKKTVFHANKKDSFKFKINFVTLTLPVLQRHKDTTIKKKLLNGFLTELRDRYRVRNYVWRAECQKNGSLHFHIVTDSFINAFALRRLWNKKLELLGYVSAYTNKFSNMSFSEYAKAVGARGIEGRAQAFKAYEYGKKTSWKNPNTTDIHSVSKIRNLAAYVSKYMAKSNQEPKNGERRSVQNRRLSGRLWACSVSLSRLKSCTEFYSSRMQEVVNTAISSGKFKVLRERYFTCVLVPVQQLISLSKKYMSGFLVDFAKECGYEPVKPPPKGYYFDKSLLYEVPK